MNAATRMLNVKTESESYSDAGQKLTRKALQLIQTGCCCCSIKTEDLFLLHLSLSSGDVTSLMLCHKCASQITVKGLIEMVAGKIISENQGGGGLNC